MATARQVTEAERRAGVLVDLLPGAHPEDGEALLALDLDEGRYLLGAIDCDTGARWTAAECEARCEPASLARAVEQVGGGWWSR